MLVYGPEAQHDYVVRGNVLATSIDSLDLAWRLFAEQLRGRFGREAVRDNIEPSYEWNRRPDGMWEAEASVIIQVTGAWHVPGPRAAQAQHRLQNQSQGTLDRLTQTVVRSVVDAAMAPAGMGMGGRSSRPVTFVPQIAPLNVRVVPRSARAFVFTAPLGLEAGRRVNEFVRVAARDVDTARVAPAAPAATGPARMTAAR